MWAGWRAADNQDGISRPTRPSAHPRGAGPQRGEASRHGRPPPGARAPAPPPSVAVLSHTLSKRSLGAVPASRHTCPFRLWWGSRGACGGGSGGGRERRGCGAPACFAGPRRPARSLLQPFPCVPRPLSHPRCRGPRSQPVSGVWLFPRSLPAPAPLQVQPGAHPHTRPRRLGVPPAPPPALAQERGERRRLRGCVTTRSCCSCCCLAPWRHPGPQTKTLSPSFQGAGPRG